LNADQQIAALREKWGDMPRQVLDAIEENIRAGRMSYDPVKDACRITDAGRAHVEINIMRGKPT
jgi:hypothetical protein